jgi:plastocyanin
MKRYLLIGATAALLAVPALAFGRATTTVTVEPNPNSFTFEPKTVTKNVGAGAIHWRWGTDGSTFSFHNVRQDVKLFYSGRLTTTDSNGYTVVPSAGSFHYYCEAHGTRTGGMAGTIKIRPQIFNKTDTSFGVRWSPATGDTGGKFDVRYRVDSGAWKVWKNDTTAAQATFGLNGKPVTVRAGRTYDIQARSEKSRDTSKFSGWSPLARVIP